MFETAHEQSTAQPSPTATDLSNQHPSSESRLDPYSGNWTIFAPQRTERPDEFVDQAPTIKTDVACPFCRGNEAITPPAVWARHIPETARLFRNVTCCEEEEEPWSVRVVPNKYPAVGDLQSDSKTAFDSGAGRRDSGLFQSGCVSGGHEVIIESPRHFHSLTQLDIAEIDLVFQAYRDRIKHYRSIEGIQYINVFKNVGYDAGASLTHSHSQLVALNQIPRPVERIVERMSHHRASTGCCLRCDVIRAERKAKERMIACDETVIAYCPFASQLPMMVRVTTLEHQSHFENLDDRALESVSRMVFRVISWLEKIRPGTAYNYCLNTCPPGVNDPSDSFHWSIDIFPRMSHVAGFEWSSGCMINPVLPEAAAAMFRKCAAANSPRRR
ncbi:galactose-1-phosphate uridylyltransferase [Rubripirellula reticaptiva]|uniref:Galactose-1-phosphate uridylyltransferase n=1 Tax=Rubripirellula reticaptiva TaxID=2528013 RepID=A0A5C6F4V9_9BACT|nr:DUF4921 family protein [Rubripirellula reticaptiva]TWU55550.1 Galactose-1-phosphate uridylyltransferase [Rubripirellula reticaptiva]